MIKKINSFFNKNTYLLFTIYLFSQPILDSLLGLFTKYNINTFIILLIKILFLIYMIYYIIFIKKEKIKYMIIILVYLFINFIINYYSKGFINTISEIKVLIKNIYLPIGLIFINILYKEKKIDTKKLVNIFIIYLLLIFIPNIFNIGYGSYNSNSTNKEGNIGFFMTANAVGSLISMLFPISIYYFYKEKNKLNIILFVSLYIYILLTLGTKAPLLCFILSVTIYLIIYLINLIRKKKYKHIIILSVSLIILLILSILLIPKTPFYKNIIIHLEFLNINSIKDLFTFKNIDHLIFSARLKILKQNLKLFWERSLFNKLFGIGYVANNNLIRTCEMDYFVILIHNGIVGFVIIYYYYFKILFNIFKKYFYKFKNNLFNIKYTSYVLSFFISILSALLAGHVLDTPSVSIFVGVIMSYIYNFKD